MVPTGIPRANTTTGFSKNESVREATRTEHNETNCINDSNNYTSNDASDNKSGNCNSDNKVNKKCDGLIFNYSSIRLTEAMVKLLNRGLNFSILPVKLDIKEVLVDFKRFERSAIWHEFWYGREQAKEYVKPIFSSKKNNFPKNYKNS